MTDDTPKTSAPRKTKWWVWAIFIAVVAAIGWDIFDFDTYNLYRMRPRLERIRSAIDPVKEAVMAKMQADGKLPEMRTVVTAANQGQPATPDWAALGFKNLPALTQETASLSLAQNGEIVAVLANLGEGMDSTEVRAKLEKDAQGMNWTYTCTSANKSVKAYFHC